jgi:hypothetical protein
MRSRNPCVLARRRLFGWNVRLLTGNSRLRWRQWPVAGRGAHQTHGRLPGVAESVHGTRAGHHWSNQRPPAKARQRPPEAYRAALSYTHAPPRDCGRSYAQHDTARTNGPRHAHGTAPPRTPVRPQVQARAPGTPAVRPLARPAGNVPHTPPTSRAAHPANVPRNPRSVPSAVPGTGVSRTRTRPAP